MMVFPKWFLVEIEQDERIQFFIPGELYRFLYIVAEKDLHYFDIIH